MYLLPIFLPLIRRGATEIGRLIFTLPAPDGTAIRLTCGFLCPRNCSFFILWIKPFLIFLIPSEFSWGRRPVAAAGTAHIFNFRIFYIFYIFFNSRRFSGCPPPAHSAPRRPIFSIFYISIFSIFLIFLRAWISASRA